MTPAAFRHTVAPRTKTIGLALALWLFGLSTSMVLIGLWGRSVAGDEVALEASTRAVLESEIVNDRVTAWIGDAVTAAASFTPGELDGVIDAVYASPRMQDALDDVVDQVVAAVLAPPGIVTEIDLSAAAESLVPTIATVLEERGVVGDAEAISVAAQSIPAIILSAEDQALVSSTAHDVKVLLSKVVVLGLVGFAVAGGVAMRLSGDYVRQLRALATRTGVSAVTFVVILRIGAWAVDPSGGRSPMAAGGAVLLNSNGHVLGIVTLGAAVVAAAMSVVIVRRRRGHLQESDDSQNSHTGELPVLVGVGAS